MGKDSPLPAQVLEINPSHPVISNLFQAKDSSPDLAKLVAEQLFDNALIAAGLLDDPRSMLPRITELLKASMNK